jgi:rhodanese-related sulfurtransferase
MKRLAVLVGIMFLTGLTVTAAGAQTVPRMTRDQLKKLLGAPGVQVIDVRAGSDWAASTIKIKGAVRETPYQAAKWAKKYRQDQTLVLYCA